MTEWTERESPGGERWLVCAPLEGAGLRHAFTLRPRREGPDVDRRPPASILRALGAGDSAPAVPRQVHGSIVARPSGDGRTFPREADAVLVEGRGTAAVATADCVGAILWSDASPAFAVIHAGWRGTAAGVLAAAVRDLQQATGAAPGTMGLAMGPAIRGCCYEVGEEVAGIFREVFPSASAARLLATRSGKTTIDLVEANRLAAVGAGLMPARVLDAGLCTMCRPDLCWSYRVEGKGAGRHWTIAARSL